jgi:primosomal protein N' (replication factor Y)
VIQSLIAGDAERFYAIETENRRRANAPPFGRFAAIIISSEDADEAAAIARLIGKSAPAIEGMRVYGPAPAPLSVLRGRHRHRILVHATRTIDVQGAIRDWLGNVEWKSGTRVAVDIDPYSFM